jgi:hypothetical protein
MNWTPAVAVVLLTACGLNGPTEQEKCEQSGGRYEFSHIDNVLTTRTALGMDGKLSTVLVSEQRARYKCVMPR